MGQIGINTTFTVSDLDEGRGFALNEKMCDYNGKEWLYVQASGAITGAGYAVVIDEEGQAAMLSTSNDAFGHRVGIPAVAFADNDYGWVQIYGDCDAILCAASCAADKQLMTTATAGTLDDTATGVRVDGVTLSAAVGGGGAATAAGSLTYPRIGDTVA